MSVGCRPIVEPLHPPTTNEWRAATRELAQYDHQAVGAEPRTLRIAVAIREPYTGQVMESRGAVAVDPDQRALRMIMLGPGGTTALDFWAHLGDYRFAVPALSLTKRGDQNTPARERVGLPVDFLRWWLMRPFSGTLLWADTSQGERRFVLRDDQAIIEIRVATDGSFWAERTTWSGLDEERRMTEREIVKASGLGCADAEYWQWSIGLTVKVHCEGVEDARPPERAFDDPDGAPEAQR